LMTKPSLSRATGCWHSRMKSTFRTRLGASPTGPVTLGGGLHPLVSFYSIRSELFA
jgi:hypothetical protein